MPDDTAAMTTIFRRGVAHAIQKKPRSRLIFIFSIVFLAVARLNEMVATTKVEFV